MIYVNVGLTLASQWKSQFDDSEETDDELAGEHLQSPEHLPALARLGVAMLQQQMFGYGSTPPSPVLHQAPEPDAAQCRSPPAAQMYQAICVATLPRRTPRPPPSTQSPDQPPDPLVKGSALDGLDVEGADVVQIPANR